MVAPPPRPPIRFRPACGYCKTPTIDGRCPSCGAELARPAPTPRPSDYEAPVERDGLLIAVTVFATIAALSMFFAAGFCAGRWTAPTPVLEATR